MNIEYYYWEWFDRRNRMISENIYRQAADFLDNQRKSLIKLARIH